MASARLANLKPNRAIKSNLPIEFPVQTAFTPEQLAQPEIAEADGILKTCVHYGFCTATCPTYVLFRDENDSPRGRIDLIRAMLEKGGTPDAKTVHHLDRCLSCLSCVTTCAVKVDYAHLIDIARTHIEKNYRRPLGERMLRRMIAELLPYPRRFALALRLARLAGPFAGLLPRRLRNLITLAAGRPAAGEILSPGNLSGRRHPQNAGGVAAELRPTGARSQHQRGDAAAATASRLRGRGYAGRRLLRRVTAPYGPRRAGQGAGSRQCRRLERGIGDAALMRSSSMHPAAAPRSKTMPIWSAANTARRIGALARDVTELLVELGLPAGDAEPYRVAYHDACSLQHGQRVIAQPRQLLARAGFEVLDVPERHFCCGSAGTYNLLQPEIAGTLGERKAAHIDSVDPDVVAAGNLGCMVQIGRFARAPVVHTVELLDWATGGPMPPALRDRRCANLRHELRTRSAPDATTGAQPVADPNPTGIW